MVKRIWHGFCSLSFRVKLCIILWLVTIVPTLLFYQLVMDLYHGDMVKASVQNTTAVLKTNNRLIDTSLQRIEDASYNMINNQMYYEFFNHMDGQIDGNTYDNNALIRATLSQQFLSVTGILDRYLYTGNWIYGQLGTEIKATAEEVAKSPLIKAAEKANGQAVWLTGYSYSDYFQKEYLKNRTGYHYEYPVTMVRQMNFQYSKKGTISRLDKDKERPVLMVQLAEETIRAFYENTIDYSGAMYGIVNKDGMVISANSPELPLASKLADIIPVSLGTSGNETVTMNQQSYLLCYDTILTRGWTSFTLIPMRAFTENAVKHLYWFQVIWLIGLIVCSVVLSILLSKIITKPIDLLIQSTRRVATGDFSANTKVPRGSDFKQLVESFNYMETQVNRLVQENYDISLRERDTQIMALTMQINPHFLHNTLNTINMLAMENDDEETADLIVSLAEIINFTFKNQEEKIQLSDEIYWVENYINIMQRRIEGTFLVEMKVPDELLDSRVPKFILQPLVENCIVHGFTNLDHQGQVCIDVWKEQERLIIQVSDNGIGMDMDELEDYKNKKLEKQGIGMINVYRRLQLIYGDQFQEEINSEKGIGTTIKLMFPFERGEAEDRIRT